MAFLLLGASSINVCRIQIRVGAMRDCLQAHQSGKNSDLKANQSLELHVGDIAATQPVFGV
jgi:hypothetical protein